MDYNRFSIKAKDILAFIPVFLLMFLAIFVLATKDDVIVNEHYQGNKILVKHYRLLDIDSVYKVYPGPLAREFKILKIQDNQTLIVKLDNNEVWKILISDTKQYKEGQTIIAIEKWYPHREVKVAGEKTTIWCKQIKSNAYESN